MKTKFSHKSVGWSYPTSTNAKRFKKAAGCWTVALLEEKTLLPTYISAHDTKEEAMQAAEKESVPYHWTFLKYEMEGA